MAIPGCFLAMALALPCSAATIAYYFDGTSTRSDHAASADVTVTDLTSTGVGSQIRADYGVDTPAGPTAGTSSGTIWLGTRSTETGSLVPGSGDDYHSFTVTANTPGSLSLDTFVFDFVAVVENNSGNMEALAQTYISVDGAAFSAIGSQFSASATDLADSSASHYFGPVTTASVDLSSITSFNSVEIRVGIADNDDNNKKAQFMQGFQLTTIPEPSTALLGGLGALLLLRRRR